MNIVLFWVCVAFLACVEVQSQLTVGSVQCYQRKCKIMEYCSEIDRTCQPCSEICNKPNHNFEPILCGKVCQDYLHDERYLKKKDNDDDDLRETVKSLSHMVTVSLTLISLILVTLAAVLFLQLYRWAKKKNVTFATLKQRLFSKKNHTNGKGNTPEKEETKKPDLRLEMPTSDRTISDHSPVTVTTSISRRPAEDSALDYAYDNPAMTNTSNTHDGRKLHDVLI